MIACFGFALLDFTLLCFSLCFGFALFDTLLIACFGFALLDFTLLRFKLPLFLFVTLQFHFALFRKFLAICVSSRERQLFSKLCSSTSLRGSLSSGSDHTFAIALDHLLQVTFGFLLKKSFALVFAGFDSQLRALLRFRAHLCVCLSLRERLLSHERAFRF